MSPAVNCARFPTYGAAPYGNRFSISGDVTLCAHAWFVSGINVIKDNLLEVMALRELSGSCSCFFQFLWSFMLVVWLYELLKFAGELIAPACLICVLGIFELVSKIVL